LSGEEKIWEGGGGGDDKDYERRELQGVLKQRRQRVVARNNSGADGHAAMHDETRPCVAWENRDAINVA
jgi:hypothetical protein